MAFKEKSLVVGQGGLTLVATCFVVLTTGCDRDGRAGLALAASDRIAVYADVVFSNGNFLTLDEASPTAEAIAVKGQRILLVGAVDDMKDVTGPDTHVVDLAGHTTIPGFYDSHVHIDTGSDPAVQDWSHIDTPQKLVAAVRERAQEAEPGEWIRASLSTDAMQEHSLPRRSDLDAVAPNHPVALKRTHVWIVNTRALEVAEITRNTPNPPGGHIDRDPEGRPDGILRETPAQRIVQRVIPEWRPDAETARASFYASLSAFLPHGITSVNIAGVRPEEVRWVQDVYDEWGDHLPRATVQVRLQPGFDEYDNVEDAIASELALLEGLRVRTGLGDARLKLGAIKMSVDGGMSGQAAWTLQPYLERPDWTGTVRIPEEALYTVGKRAHDLGWQLGIHVVGDAAAKAAVGVLDRILDESPRLDHRHHLHHWTVQAPEATLEVLRKHDIIVASQPNFTYSLAPYYANALEGERLASNNPQASLLDRGIRIAYGSQGSDGLPTGPFSGLYAAVTRRGVDGRIYGEEERVTIETALRLYTKGSAYLTFDEDDRGSIRVGKLADLTVLSENIVSVSPERLRDVEAVMTVVGGRVLWKADGFADVPPM